MINNFDISSIKQEVINIVKESGVSQKVLPNRPKSSSPASDFVVVGLVNGVNDLATYGECTIRIDLFAKDIDGLINEKKLSAMYQKLILGFPAASGRLLFDLEWNLLGDIADDFGFHARLIRIKTTIKAI
jgi:hypothetical protein